MHAVSAANIVSTLFAGDHLDTFTTKSHTRYRRSLHQHHTRLHVASPPVPLHRHSPRLSRPPTTHSSHAARCGWTASRARLASASPGAFRGARAGRHGEEYGWQIAESFSSHALMHGGTATTPHEHDTWDLSPTMQSRPVFIQFGCIAHPSLLRQLWAAN
ncbi:hypothetical protein FIBSPDRAFT_1044771, partial [Athelia psychrophila]